MKIKEFFYVNIYLKYGLGIKVYKLANAS